MTTTANMTVAPEMNANLLFSWFDYTLFALMLGISAVIGVYFGLFKKQDNITEYILGGKQMKAFPVAVSLTASYISGITILGVPSDVYMYGASYWLCVVSITLVSGLTVFVYLPVFYKLQLTSSNEYLKLRFDHRLQILASLLFTLSSLLYLPVVIYVPALAFSQATGINTHFITPIVCIVCIFYTTLGGLKAVIWTDTLQFIVMIIAMIAVLVLGFIAMGSVQYVFQKSYEGGRLYLWDFDPDPTNRTSFWTVIIGMTTSWTSYVAIHQSCIQKFLSLPSITSVKKSIIMFIIGIIVVKSTSVITGLIIYSKYSNCDPIMTNQIDKIDQLLPYFVIDVAGHIPGLSGLFIAGIFSAALSTMSAVLNTLSGIIYEDFIKFFMPPNTSEKRASDIMKCTVVIVGALSTSMVYIVQHLDSILPLSISFGGLVHGPLLGMFSLGMLVPFATSQGALFGSISGLLVNGFIIVGTQYNIAHGGIVKQKLPTFTDGCDFPIAILTNITTNATESFGYTPPWIFRISMYYYALIGASVTILIGIIISLLTDGRKQKVNRDLLSPAIYFTLPKEQNYADYKTVEQAMEIMNKNLQTEFDKNILVQR